MNRIVCNKKIERTVRAFACNAACPCSARFPRVGGWGGRSCQPFWHVWHFRMRGKRCLGALLSGGSKYESQVWRLVRVLAQPGLMASADAATRPRRWKNRLRLCHNESPLQNTPSIRSQSRTLTPVTLTPTSNRYPYLLSSSASPSSSVLSFLLHSVFGSSPLKYTQLDISIKTFLNCVIHFGYCKQFEQIDFLKVLL